jgi:hypothetical protein
MNYYEMLGLKIKTKIDFGSLLYRTQTKNGEFDFQIIYDPLFLENSLFTQSELKYRNFLIGEANPFKEVYQVNGNCFLIKWLNKYTFFIDPIHNRLIVNSEEMNGEWIGILFSKIISLLLYIKGYSQLHGSAVRYMNQTIGFIGESGSGKSTAASLCIDDGGKMITDDLIAFNPEDCLVISGFPNIRLTPSVITLSEKVYFEEYGKLRYHITENLHSRETSPLHCIFFLEVNDQKGLCYRKLRGNEQIIDLLENVYNKEALHYIFYDSYYKRIMTSFLLLASTIPMFKVYRHSKTKPEELFSLIHSLLRSL